MGDKLVKSRIIRSAVLLVCIGIIVVTSVEPIAGQMMGEHSANETDMMQHMEEHMREHMENTLLTKRLLIMKMKQI